MTVTEIQAKLLEKKACQPGLDYVATRSSLEDIVRNCPQIFWLFFLAEAIGLLSEDKCKEYFVRIHSPRQCDQFDAYTPLTLCEKAFVRSHLDVAEKRRILEEVFFNGHYA